MAESITITVYTRNECHLCTTAIETIHHVVDSVPRDVDIALIDIAADDELRAEYGERVPYVFVDGRPQFKYRVDAAELRDILTDDC